MCEFTARGCHADGIDGGEIAQVDPMDAPTLKYETIQALRHHHKMDMNADQYSHIVAMYMRALFRSRLSSATGKPKGEKTPSKPSQLTDDMIMTCHSAVDTVVKAFLNIGMSILTAFRTVYMVLMSTEVYIDWDFRRYCNDCEARRVYNRPSEDKEAALEQCWPPLHSTDLQVYTPRAFADPKGRIIAWVLPSIIPSKIRVAICSFITMAVIRLPLIQTRLLYGVKLLEKSMVSNLASATSDRKKSWRTDQRYFRLERDCDAETVRNGLINCSPAWFMAGHSVSCFTLEIPHYECTHLSAEYQCNGEHSSVN